MRSLLGYGVLAPPNSLIVLCFVSAIIALTWQRTGISVMLAASFSLFVAATPAFSSWLLVWLEDEISNNADYASAQAIVVLGADFRSGYGRVPDRLGPQSLERVLLTADAYKQLHLPVAVSGGPPFLDTSVARMMEATLEQSLAVPVTWREEHSQTTYENAAFTAPLLKRAGIGTVILVTQARDLPRAIWCFERVGLRVVAWPAPRTNLNVNRVADFLPNTEALNETFYGLHELIGAIYYRVHY